MCLNDSKSGSLRKTDRELGEGKGDFVRHMEQIFGEERDAGQEDVKKRLRNLVWTVSGDYSLNANVSLSAFQASKDIAIYDAVLLGAFAKYFDRDKMRSYRRKKILGGAEPTVLDPILWMCGDSAVWKKASLERSGVAALRRRAFQETLLKDKMRLTHTSWGALEAEYLRFCLDRTAEADWARKFIDLIRSIEDALETEEIIRCADRIYEEAYEKGFAEWFKGLKQLMKADGREEEQFCERGEGETKEQTVELTDGCLLREEDNGNREREKSNLVLVDEESMKRLGGYLEQNYGSSYLSSEEKERLEERICKEVHSGSRLHFTEGLLHGPGSESPKSEFDRRVRDENLRVYYQNEPIARQNIHTLADILRRGLFCRREPETFYSEYGDLCVRKLWNLGRTDSRRLFTRRTDQNCDEFVVDVLIDSSGSQQVRQSKVALQAYIVSQALAEAGIAHRVMGFCTFGEYTVMRRFRDYEEGPEAEKRIFEFYGSANNRDGLAIRAVADELLKRKEENKILIILSDGAPNDIITTKKKSNASEPYCSEFAIKDTANEVYKLRNQGVMVLGIFAGEEESLKAERKMFGNEFVYIRDIAGFSNVVGRYLKEQILER